MLMLKKQADLVQWALVLDDQLMMSSSTSKTNGALPTCTDCDTVTRKRRAHLSFSFHNWFCTELPLPPLTSWIIGIIAISAAAVDKDENISAMVLKPVRTRKGIIIIIFSLPSKKSSNKLVLNLDTLCVCIIRISCCCHRGNSFSLASSSTTTTAAATIAQWQWWEREGKAVSQLGTSWQLTVTGIKSRGKRVGEGC